MFHSSNPLVYTGNFSSNLTNSPTLKRETSNDALVQQGGYRSLTLDSCTFRPLLPGRPCNQPTCSICCFTSIPGIHFSHVVQPWLFQWPDLQRSDQHSEVQQVKCPCQSYPYVNVYVNTKECQQHFFTTLYLQFLL